MYVRTFVPLVATLIFVHSIVISSDAFGIKHYNEHRSILSSLRAASHSNFDEKVEESIHTHTVNNNKNVKGENYFSEDKRERYNIIKENNMNHVSSRRKVLGTIMTASTVLCTLPLSANAGIAQIDSKSGELFSPKKEMLGGGGSDLARGVKLQSRTRGAISYNNVEPIQTVYETRFITYLSRFLLNFDPAASSWWSEQEFDTNGKMSVESQRKLRFAEFAESVEIGLADYFVGPYGSYASVQAALAGLRASAPASSSSSAYAIKNPGNFFDRVFEKRKLKGNNESNDKAVSLAKQGVLNLFSLLKARYTSTEEKKQLAILFSLITDDRLQPTSEIKGLLGEVDNGKIVGIKLNGLLKKNASLIQARSSSHHGGGYSINEIPSVTIESPPSLGAKFVPAQLEPIMKSTSRILRIKVTDGGAGYTSSPKVDVIQNGVKISCEAQAILDRNGSVDSVIVLNPGFGYHGKNGVVDVAIAPPKKSGSDRKNAVKKKATAIAELEYAITDINVVNGGSGYVLSEPPKISITLPEDDPDWYMSPIDKKTWQVIETNEIEASVQSMSCSNSKDILFVDNENIFQFESNPSIFNELENDSLALLPSTLRPFFDRSNEAGGKSIYKIISLPKQTSSIFLPSQRYRAYDSIFGGIGSNPVLQKASKLTGSEYLRIAISGAICTVIVRTALNPLELVKTKIQLQNDDELLENIHKGAHKELSAEANTKVGVGKSTNVGTVDVMKALSRLRGPSSLFQSADITFLASVVFGSFGFGATELFRRSFTDVFFSDGTGSKGGEEITLLIAAAFACILTSAVAAPFELMRVRSMAYINAQSLNVVFSDFLREERVSNSKLQYRKDDNQTNRLLGFQDLSGEDIKSLFSGFYPIVSRELPFAVVKFLVFDLIASSTISIINSQPQIIEPIQVGVGSIGLIVSALSGALAGLFGAFVSHPADLILTLTSSQKRSSNDSDPDWKDIVKDLLSKDGGALNLYAGFPARASFFFLVIGLQFFLYDYAKTVFQVGSDDLTLVLDVFYAIRQGLVDTSQ